MIKSSDARSTDRLLETLKTEFGDARPARDLFREFLPLESYERSFASKLLEVARQNSGVSWEVRCLAVLMLENQLLRLPASDAAEWGFVLTRLGLKISDDPPHAPVKESLLREGYTTTHTPDFIVEFRRRLERLRRAHDALNRKHKTRGALLDFLRLSRRECKLTLARYALRPEEVVSRILSLVRTSRGVADLHPFEPGYVAEEATHATLLMPDYEARILRLLTGDSLAYWVADATSSEINSLVEYPLTTVVLVLKLPGSHVELEIKRAGRRGVNPLGVVYRRADGSAAPVSHRLDGGSAQEGLRYEAHSASRFSRIFRLAHDGRAAPIPDYLTRISVRHVPTGAGEVNMLDYLDRPQAFGAGFAGMREALAEAVAAFSHEYGANLHEVPGALGLTMHFLTYATPAQAVISGTTSFRLDLLTSYLSDDGDKTYFAEGLKVEPSKLAAKQFADELLEEVLCVYRPPRVAFRSHAAYLDAAFAVRANRARADENYLSVMRQIGTFWGTLLAIRGHSMGESFVARNVGLRSVWEEGRWQIKIIFMDHDNLQTNEVTPADFQAVGILKSLSADDVFIWGELESGEYTNSESHCLEKIYRVSPPVVARGRIAFRDATLGAYKKTHAELSSNPGFRSLVHDSFARRIRDWDAIIRTYLRPEDARGDIEAWRKESRDFLEGEGYEDDLIGALLLSVESYADFLGKYSYLFES